MMRKLFRQSEFKLREEEDGLDPNIMTVLFLGFLCAYVILAEAIISGNPGNYWISWMLAVSGVLLFIIHFFRKHMSEKVKLAVPYVLIILVTVAEYMSQTDIYKIIILVITAYIVIEYPLDFVQKFFVVPLMLFILGSLVKMQILNNRIPPDYLVSYVFKNTVTYLLVVGSFYTAKRQMIMNHHLIYLMDELKEKNRQLEEASVLEERNRIAREIHDTLGHTLTGAIIQLEVAKKFIYTSPEKADTSIQKTQEITRQGLTEVKRAIKALKPVMIEENTLEGGLNLLFERVERDYGLIVEDRVLLPENITEDMKVAVFRIIQELTTNTIRHGKADRMTINIDYSRDVLRINTQDNGGGCSSLKEGNGLRGIRERVEQMKGHLKFVTAKDEGFVSVINIPIH